MMTELKQLIDSKQVGSVVMLGLLYMIVGFGVFGTIVMMTAERKKEFGLMVSVGMKKTKLMFIVFIETVLLGFVGVVLGFAVTLPLIFYFHYNPIALSGEMADAYVQMGIDPVFVFSTNPGFMIWQVVVMTIIVLLSVCYPLLKVYKLMPVDAMKN